MIRYINDGDFLYLLDLYKKMYNLINPNLSISSITIILSDEIRQANYKALGYFRNNKLLGIIAGHDLGSKSFIATAYYSESSIVAGKLFKFLEAELKKFQYISWSTEVHYNFSESIVPKLGAEIEYIRYKKEL